MAQAASSVLRLGEATEQEAVAREWLGREGLDGIVAKRLDLPYQSGERAMRKFKLWKTDRLRRSGTLPKAWHSGRGASAAWPL